MMTKTKIVGKKVIKEEEDFIRDLRQRNDSLQKENNTLQGKLKKASSVVQKYKNQLQSLKCRYGSSINTFSKSTYRNGRINSREDKRNEMFNGRHITGGCKISVDNVHNIRPECDEDVTAVLSQLQERLLDSENIIEQMKNENEQLKICKFNLQQIQNSQRNIREGESHEIHSLRQELNEARENLRSINVQYNNLETNAEVQLDIQKQTRLKLEQCNAYIMKLQNEIQILRTANEKAKRNERRVEEQKEHVQDLLEENRLLEDNLTKLCELPFAKEEKPSIVSTDHIIEDQIIELEAKEVNSQQQIKELTTENTTLKDSISALQEKTHQLEMDNNHLKSEVYEFNLKQLHSREEETQTDLIDERHEIWKNESIDKDTQTENSLDEHRKIKFDKSSQTCNILSLDSNSIVNNESTSLESMDDGGKISLPQQENSEEDKNYEKESSSKDINQNISSENTLEVIIKSFELREHMFCSEAKFIITLDYLDHETISSSIYYGRSPKLGFGVKYNLKGLKVETLLKSSISLHLYEIKSSKDFDLVGTLTLSLIEVNDSEDCDFVSCIELLSKNRMSDTVGQVEIMATLQKPIICKKNCNFSHSREKNLHSEEDDQYSTTNEDKKERLTQNVNQCIVADNEEKLKRKNKSSSVLEYFVKENHINYIDFLRFVDPPYPILYQIRALQKIEKQLSNSLGTYNGNNFLKNSHDINEDFVSEEKFVSAIAELNTSDVQLEEIHNVYRHIDVKNNGDSSVATTSRRLLFFLYSSEMAELRRLFYSFRKSSIDPWGPFKVADIERTGFVSKATFNECIRSIGIEGLVIL